MKVHKCENLPLGSLVKLNGASVGASIDIQHQKLTLQSQP